MLDVGFLLQDASDEGSIPKHFRCAAHRCHAIFGVTEVVIGATFWVTPAEVWDIPDGSVALRSNTLVECAAMRSNAQTQAVHTC